MDNDLQFVGRRYVAAAKIFATSWRSEIQPAARKGGRILPRWLVEWGRLHEYDASRSPDLRDR
jgi:hypothetical protein